MPELDNQQTQPAASTAALAEQPANVAPMFTADQVVERERVAAQRAHDAAMAEARRVFEGKQRNSSPPAATQQPATQSAAPQPAATSVLDIARVVQFTTEATQIGIPPAGVEMLLSRLESERPSDVRAWVATQAESFGWRKPAATNPATSTPATPASQPFAAPAPTNAAPVTGNAAPTNPTTVTADTPLISLPEATRLDMMRRDLLGYTERFRAEAMRDKTRFRLR